MAELKISDLSVGDWICVQFPNGNKWNERVLHLSNTGRLEVQYKDGEVVRCTIDFIHPIPITPEILEKIGFEKREGCLWYHPHIKCGCYRFGSKYWDIRIKYKNRGYRPTRIAIDNILHIHQLQHALRLAGVEKEIELW